jgi:hypothetical protein
MHKEDKKIETLLLTAVRKFGGGVRGKRISRLVNSK